MLTLSHLQLLLKENHHVICSFGVYSLWEYWLGKTEKLAASSTVELVLWLLKRPFIKKGVPVCKK